MGTSAGVFGPGPVNIGFVMGQTIGECRTHGETNFVFLEDGRKVCRLCEERKVLFKEISE